jgi:hypothetical protein
LSRHLLVIVEQIREHLHGFGACWLGSGESLALSLSLLGFHALRLGHQLVGIQLKPSCHRVVAKLPGHAASDGGFLQYLC